MKTEIIKKQKLKLDLTKQINKLVNRNKLLNDVIANNRENARKAIDEKEKLSNEFHIKVKEKIKIEQDIQKLNTEAKEAKKNHKDTVGKIREEGQKEEYRLKAIERDVNTKVLGMREKERKLVDSIAIKRSKLANFGNKLEKRELGLRKVELENKRLLGVNLSIVKNISHNEKVLKANQTRIAGIRKEYTKLEKDKEKSVKDREKVLKNVTKLRAEKGQIEFAKTYNKNREKHLTNWEAYLENQAKKLKIKYVKFTY